MLRRASRGVIVAVIGFGALSVGTALAAQSTTIVSANAPTGTHYKSGAAGCSVDSGTVSCVGYTLAGVGNSNATAKLSATYSATVVCINGGNNPSDSQHQGSFTDSSSTKQLEPKNGNLTVPPLSASPPTVQAFLS